MAESLVLLNVPFAEKDLAKPYGARWEPNLKKWYFPGTTEAMPEPLRRWLPPSAAPAPAQSPQERTKNIVLSIPFDMKGLAAEYKARWSSEWRSHIWQGQESQLPGILKDFRPAAFSWEEYAERQLNGEGAPKPLAGAGDITLRKHQESGVAEINAALNARYPGFLLGDDAGLGKTITSWTVICQRMKPGQTVIVICPLSVVAAWRETIMRLGHPGINVIILNYDRMNRLFQDESGTAKSKKGLAKKGEALDVDAIIFDETQRLRNLEAARTKFALALYEKTNAFFMWLSATAGENPLELGYLLPLLVRTSGINPDGRTTLLRFEDWCKRSGLAVKRGAFGKWEWDENNEADCKRLHNLLFNRKDGVVGAIRRRPEDIEGWPSLQRIPHPVDLSSEQREAYNLEWKAFLKAMEGMPVSKRHAPDGGIAALIRFRQKASLLRVDDTVDLVMDLLEENHRVAISCQWIGTVKALIEALQKKKVTVVDFTGETPNREENRKRFQRGEADVIIFSVEEGINLQQGEILVKDKRRAQIDHDIRWSAISMKQIDHRCHRDGKFAKVYWSFATNTKEFDVGQRVLKKLSSMSTLSGDDPKFITELSNLFFEAAR